MKIYTRSGDQGQTTTQTKRVAKSDSVIHLLGTIDRLNATFGWAGVVATSYQAEIKRTQDMLFEIGAWLSNDASANNIPVFESDVTMLENEIDATCAPPLENFVLPGGDEFAARLHIARCDTRLVERLLWEHLPTQTQVHVYLNRLSDWCFAVSRHVLHSAGGQDVVWQARTQR
jgi:cob(I)alamin adenosyltransferase